MEKNRTTVSKRILSLVLAFSLIIGMAMPGAALPQNDEQSGQDEIVSGGNIVLPMSTADVLNTIERMAGQEAVDKLQEMDSESPSSLREGSAASYADQELEQFIATLDAPEQSSLMQQSLRSNMQGMWLVKAYEGNGYKAAALLNPDTLDVQIVVVNNSNATQTVTLDVVDESGNAVEVSQVSGMVEKSTVEFLTRQEIEDYEAQGASIELRGEFPEEETTAPVEEETTAPVEEETAAPAEEETTAPAEEETAAPAEDETTAPAEDETTAPADDEIAAPVDEETTAPAEDETTAPAEVDVTAEVEAIVIESQSVAASGAAAALRFAVPANAQFFGSFFGITPYGGNYTVELYIGGQLYGQPFPVKSGETINEIPNPPESDWPADMIVCDGWFVAGTDEKFDFSTPITQDIRLEAKFRSICTITYKDQKGNIIDTVVVRINEPIPEAKYDITSPEGLHFVHWYEDKPGVDPATNPFVFTTAAKENITLKPYFSDEYYVIFLSTGTQVTTQRVKKGSVATQPPSPTRTGYTFSHWSTEENGSAYDFSTPVNGQVRLHAVWNGATTSYQVVYWLEKANVKGTPGAGDYEITKSLRMNGANTGSTVALTESQADANILTELNTSKNALHFSKFARSDSKIIAGNGTTVINVYYNRVVYTLNFTKGNAAVGTIYASSNGNRPTVTASHTADSVIVSLPVKFQQNIADEWPLPSPVANQSFSSFSRPNGAGYASKRYVADDDMLNFADRNAAQRTQTLTGSFTGASNTFIVQYWLETPDGSGTANNITGETRYYKIEPSYTQPVSTTTNLSPKPLDGFVANGKEGAQTAGAIQKFYYTRNSYTLEINYGDPDRINTTQQVLHGKRLADCNLPTPSRVGYTFKGWYVDTELATPLHPNAVMPIGNTVIFAKWESTQNTVNFYDRVGSTTKIADSRGYDDGAFIEYPDAPVKDQPYKDYGIFNGWWWIHPDSGILMAHSPEIPVAGNLDLYAVWKKGTISVTYDVGRGSGSAPVDNQFYIEGANVSLYNPVGVIAPEGMVFCGWAAEGEGQHYYPKNLYKITKDTTFVAQYMPETEVVKLVYHPGTLSNSGQDDIIWYVPKGHSVYLLNAQYKSMYGEMIGWADKDSQTNVQWTLEELVAVGNGKQMDVYPVYKKHNLQVSWLIDPDQGALNGDQERVLWQGIESGTDWADLHNNPNHVQPEVTGKPGYYFVGWNQEIPTNGEFTRDMTFVAQMAETTKITLTAGGGSKVYDGMPITPGDYTVSDLGKEYTMEAKQTNPSITDVDRTEVTITEYKILKDGKDVTEQFDVDVKIGILEVTPCPVHIQPENKTKKFGEADPTLTAIEDGKPDQGVPLVYTLLRADGENVGEYPIWATVDDAQNPNYLITSDKKGVLTITKASTGIDITIPGADKDGNVSVVYDGLAHEFEVNATAPEGTCEVTYSTESADGPFTADKPSAKNVADGKTIYYKVTHPNYNDVTGFGELEITKCPVTIKADDKSKEFGKADPKLTATVDGKPPAGDDVTYTSIERVSGETVDTYEITVTPGENPNYTVTAEKGTFTITKASTGIDITIPGADKDGNVSVVYDGLAHEFEVNATAPEGTCEVTYSTESADGPFTADKPSAKNVADGKTIYYKVTHPNYNDVTGSGKLEITKCPVTIKADDKSKEFGKADPKLTATVDGKPPAGDDVTYTSIERVPGETVDTYEITVTPGENPNYTVTAVKGTFTITKASSGIDITIPGADADGNVSVVYDGEAHEFVLNATAPEGTCEVTYSTTGEDGPFTADKPSAINVADTKTIYYKVTHPNYNDVTGFGKLEIAKRPVTIKADNITIAYGDNEPALTATVTGKPPAGVDVTYTSIDRVPGNDVGEYEITVTPGVNPNYAVTTEKGKFTITKASGGAGITVEGMDAKGNVNVEYDGKAHQIKLIMPNGITGHTITYATNKNGPYTASNPSATNVADSKTVYYKVTHPNYADTEGSAKLNITPCPVTVMPDDQTREFGKADPKLTATEGNKPTDGVKINYTLSRTSGSAVGTYPITVTLGSNPNYTVTAGKGTFTITKASGGIDVTVPRADANGNVNVVYDGKPHQIDLKVTGATGYTITYATSANGSFTTKNPSATNVGDTEVWYKVTHPSYADATGSAKLTITPCPVTITANDATKEFGKADPKLTATEGNKPTAGANLIYTLKRVAGEDVKDYEITVTPGANPNYTVTTKPGKFTITKNSSGMKVSAANGGVNVRYDGDEHPIQLNITGVTGSPNPTITYSKYQNGPFGAHPSAKNVADSGTIYYKVTHPSYADVTGSAKLTITPCPVTITADDATKVFGASDPTLTSTVTNQPTNGDALNRTVRRAAGENVGTYAITVTPGSNPNYTVTTKPGTFTITKASGGITVDVDKEGSNNAGVNVPYDGKPHQIKVNVTGATGYTIMYGTSANGPFTTTNPSATNVAESKTVHYKVTHPSYEDVIGSAPLTITKRAVTVTADDKTKEFGKADPTLTATETGKPPAGVAVQYTLVRETGEARGTYDITVKPGSNPNYDVTPVAGTFKIEKAKSGMNVTVKDGGVNVLYDGKPHPIQLNITGVTGSPNPTITYSKYQNGPFGAHPSAKNVEDSGTIYYKVTHPDYEDVTGSAPLTIRPRDLRISFPDVSKLQSEVESPNDKVEVPAVIESGGHGLAASDNASAFKGIAETGGAVGTYPIKLDESNTTLMKNYTIKIISNGKVTVTEKIVLRVIVNDVSAKRYTLVPDLYLSLSVNPATALTDLRKILDVTCNHNNKLGYHPIEITVSSEYIPGSFPFVKYSEKYDVIIEKPGRLRIY